MNEIHETALVPPTQAAKALGVTYSTISAWRRAGCPAHTSGKAGVRVVHLFNLDEVRVWLDGRRAALSATGKELEA